MNEYEKMGLDWLQGKVVISSFQGLKFNAKQKEFINAKDRFNLISGGMASGKTLAYIVKFILFSQFFPGSKHLIGRKTKENAQDTFMKDFMDICPPELYEHQKGYGRIVFSNGSEAEFWGLDALQSGATTDIKKAEQKLKSHNFSFIWMDQLEESEEKVFNALNSRLRRRQCKHSAEEQEVHRNEKGNPVFELCKVCGRASFNQMNMTTNPANFWGYQFFKVNPSPFSHLVETSMMDNKDYLSEQFLQSELAKPKRYVQKYVYGEWSPDSLVESAVFAEDHIKEQGIHVRPPEREINGIKIYKEPGLFTYQVGVDPSDGSVDPCSIQVVCKETGELVASFSGYIPHELIAQKAVTMALMYAIKDKPLIVPESTGAGQALIEHLKTKYDNIYVRQVFNQREDTEVNKLGFSTNYASKKLLIEHMNELFENHFPKIYDRETVEEMKTFIYSDEVKKKGAGAQAGYHDDRLMALMLAFWDVKGKGYQAIQNLNTQARKVNVYTIRKHKSSYE